MQRHKESLGFGEKVASEYAISHAGISTIPEYQKVVQILFRSMANLVIVLEEIKPQMNADNNQYSERTLAEDGPSASLRLQVRTWKD